ncbi:MAG: hypothetical protein AAFW98_02905 [Pseudomonadota bacterium]
MTAIWALTAQAIMAFLGYCAALFAAATFASVALTGFASARVQTEFGEVFHTLVLITSTTVSALPVTLVPTVIAVAITEGFRIRGFVAYCVIGAVVGLAAALPIRAVLSGAAMPVVDLNVVQLFVASGAVGGLVYWTIAGRSAGRWTELRWFEVNRR